MGNEDLYNSQKWKSLNPTDRAQLLLVIEKLKLGTIIGGNWAGFIEILEEAGLGYSLNSEPLRIKPVFVVARPEVLLERERKYLTLSQNFEPGTYHKISGWLLSYPELCIEEYIHPRTNQEKDFKKNKRHLSYNFGRELTKLIEDSGEYPDIFNYRPPSFTPCSISCPNAIDILTKWKDTIVSLDEVAARDMRNHHRRGYPARLAHKEFYMNEQKNFNWGYKLASIRGQF